MGAKANKEIAAARVDRCVELISLCKSTAEIIKVGKAEWGLSERQIEVYICKARAKIRERFDQMDRKDWIASALERLDRVADMSIECRQHSNAIGALGLQAKLLQLTTRDN
jgi:hypothetical protein